MATWIVFLRAINLGARRRFGKDDIVAATERAGFDGVATHINTGNVRVQTAFRSRARIEGALETAYLEDRGFEVPAIAFPCSELVEVAADADALGRGHDGNHYVSLLKDEPAPDVARALEERSSEQEVVRVRGRAVHLMLGPSYHQARLSNATVEKSLGVATSRNLTVIRALVQKWC